MKTLLLSTVLVFSALQARADDRPLTLREHMQLMSFQLDSALAHSENPDEYGQAAESTRGLRSHLVIAIGLTPPKIEELAAGSAKNKAMIEYHEFIARVIYLSCTLERAFESPEYKPISNSRQQDIRNLLHEINVLMGRGHGKFR